MACRKEIKAAQSKNADWPGIVHKQKRLSSLEPVGKADSTVGRI